MTRRGVTAAVIVTAVAVSVVAGTVALGQTSEDEGDNALTAESVAEYEDAIFTNTTPEKTVAKLRESIAEFEAYAAEATSAGDQSDASAQEEAASFLEKAAYLEGLLTLVCEQEAPVGC